MDTNYILTQIGQWAGTFIFSWVSLSFIAQWTQTPIYDSEGNVMWGNTAWLVFLAILVSMVLVIIVQLIVWFFVGVSKTA